MFKILQNTKQILKNITKDFYNLPKVVEISSNLVDLVGRLVCSCHCKMLLLLFLPLKGTQQ